MGLSIRGRLRKGRLKLVVYGVAGKGYRLAAQSRDKVVSPFGPVFGKQGDAVNEGQRKFNLTASPVYPNKKRKVV